MKLINRIVFGILLFTPIVFISCKKDQTSTPAPLKPPGIPAIIDNKPPVAYANADTTVAAGCGKGEIGGFWTSSDPSASILWRQIAGPTQSNIINPNQVKTLVTNLIAGKYRYILEVSDRNGSSRDTIELTVQHTKEVKVENLMWVNIVDDIVHVWEVTIQRPDLFCDTSQIKDILIMNNNTWITTDPIWKGPGLSQFVLGTNGMGSGHYYELLPPDRLRIYVYGSIWNQLTSAIIRLY